jgi:signal peptidase I
VTTIAAGGRRASGRHRKAPERRGAGAAKNALVLVARRAALALALGAVVLVVLGHALGWSVMIVRSGSMEPAVPVGGLVLAQRVSGQDVRVGDAIAVQRTGGGRPVTVLHRIISLSERDGHRVAQLKGDANPTPDPDPVTLSQPVPRLVLAVPGAGYALSYVRSAAQPSRLLIVGGGALGLWLIWGTGRQRRRGRRAARAERGTVSAAGTVAVHPGGESILARSPGWVE